MKLLLTVLASSMLLSCATPYGKYGLAGGYTDARIDANTFSISVETNGFTNQQTTSMHALFRAAELTVQNGFDFFFIVGGANSASSMTVAIPGTSTSNTTVTPAGSTAYARTTTTSTPTTFIPLAFPNSSLTIKSFTGSKPADAPNAYDARSVIEYLGPQIGVTRSLK